MRLTARHVSIALLLIVLIGHVSVAVHAATHASGEALECELCISHGDSSGAPAQFHDHGVSAAHDTHVLPLDVTGHAPRLPTSIHQRGPPVIL